MLRRALTGVRAQALRAASVGPLAHEPPLRHLPLHVEANPPWSGASCGACAASCSAQQHALTASSLRSLRVAGRCIASAAASAASAAGDGRAAAQRRGGRQGPGCAAASSSLVRHCPACWSHGPGRCGGHAARRCARGHGVAQREWLGTLLAWFLQLLVTYFRLSHSTQVVAEPYPGRQRWLPLGSLFTGAGWRELGNRVRLGARFKLPCADVCAPRAAAHRSSQERVRDSKGEKGRAQLELGNLQSGSNTAVHRGVYCYFSRRPCVTATQSD